MAKSFTWYKISTVVQDDFFSRRRKLSFHSARGTFVTACLLVGSNVSSDIITRDILVLVIETKSKTNFVKKTVAHFKLFSTDQYCHPIVAFLRLLLMLKCSSKIIKKDWFIFLLIFETIFAHSNSFFLAHQI